MRAAIRWLGAALILAGLAAIHPWASDRRSPGLARPAPAEAPPSEPTLRPASRLASPVTDLPHDTIGLAALTEAAQTTVAAFTAEGGIEPIAGPIVLDEHTPTLRAGVLAYLALPGLSPAENYIEARDLSRGGGWTIPPEAGNAIFGFALDPAGARLAYLEADARVVAARLPWRVVVVNLASGAKKVLLDQTGLGEIALSPIGWSPQMILFRGLIPFTDQHRGLWAARPDGSEVRQIAVEEDFVGLPQFSPEGDRLALPVSDLSALPAGYGAGEPPANIIRILDLRDGHQAVIGPSAARQTVAGLEWTSDGLAALVGKWDADRAISAYRSAVVWSPAADGGGERVLLSTGASELSHLAACPDGSWLVAIQSGGDAQIVRADEKSLTTIAVRHGPALDWLACWQ